MQTFGISFVDDDALDHHDFVYVDVPGGGWMFYRESGLSPVSLEDSCAAAIAAQSAPRRSLGHRIVELTVVTC